MLTQLPTYVPPLSVMLPDLGNPPPAAIARALDVSPATVRRWIAADRAPRAVMLSLFWLTRWGRSEIDCRAVNDARIQSGLASSLRSEVARLEKRVRRICRIADFGSANDPEVFFASEKPGSMAFATEPASCFIPSGNDPYPRDRTSTVELNR